MNVEEEKQSPLSIVITGTRLPVIALVSLLATLIVSVIYATIWLTKIDDRSLTTADLALQNQLAISKHAEILHSIEKSNEVMTAILEELVEDHKHTISLVREHNRNAESWKRRIVKIETLLENLRAREE